MAVDWNGTIDEGVQAAKGTYNALVTLATDAGVPGFIAQAVAFAIASIVAVGRVLYILALFTFVSIGTSLVTAVLQVIKQIRQDGAADFAEVTGEAMGEFMAIDTAQVDFAAGKDAAASLKRRAAAGRSICGYAAGAIRQRRPPITRAGRSSRESSSRLRHQLRDQQRVSVNDCGTRD
jgi:hypothetical protein